MEAKVRPAANPFEGTSRLLVQLESLRQRICLGFIK